MKFSLVPYGSVHTVTPSLMTFLLKSEMWTAGRAHVDDILAFVYSGRMQLWIFHDEPITQVSGFVITEIKDYPRKKVLVMQYCASLTHMVNDVGPMAFKILERYAKDGDCNGMEFFGRPGWMKTAKTLGFKTQTVVYDKFWS